MTSNTKRRQLHFSNYTLVNICPMNPTRPLSSTLNNLKTILSAQSIVYMNSANFISINLKHHDLGMLYKDDEKSKSKGQ